MSVIPAHIQVGPKTYRVELTERLIASTDKSKSLLGECEAMTSTIRLDSMFPKRLTDTFFHEVLHAIDYEYTLNIDHETLNRLANALLDTIQRNKLSFVEDFSVEHE